jgi:hypothetical protein
MAGLSCVHYKNDTDNGGELYCTDTSCSCNRLSSEAILRKDSVPSVKQLFKVTY